jgi:IS605 OrfB family transposase
VEWKLWNVAGGIVREARMAVCGTIAVEDLKHIRDRIRVAKKQRLIQHGWPFASLVAKIKHVAARHGIAVAEVDARNTSQTCSRCGHCERGNRPSQSCFRCLSCGYSQHADYNAAHNIRARYAERGCGAVTHRLKSAPRGRAKKAAVLQPAE